MESIMKNITKVLLVVFMVIPVYAEDAKGILQTAVNKLSVINKTVSGGTGNAAALAGLNKNADPNSSLHLGNDGARLEAISTKNSFSGKIIDKTSASSIKSVEADSSTRSNQGRPGGQ
jgi:hypothetical protein